MTADDLLEAVRDDQKTELSRLGNSKSLYADTEGDMNEESVLTALADHFHAASETLESWADGADGDAADVFAAAAETVSGVYDGIASELGDHDPGETPAVVEYLNGLEGTDGLLGGYVGWLLAIEKKVGQAVGFFVGQAAPGAADTFRGVRDDLNDAIDEAVAALGDVCADEDDWTLAETAAVETVVAAYDDYFETLESLGVNPKPVC